MYYANNSTNHSNILFDEPIVVNNTKMIMCDIVPSTMLLVCGLGLCTLLATKFCICLTLSTQTSHRHHTKTLSYTHPHHAHQQNKKRRIKNAFVIILRRSHTKPHTIKMLLQCRHDTSAHGAGCWSLVGGQIDAHETSLQAVIRECKEETGYVLQRKKCVLIGEIHQAHIYVYKLPSDCWRIQGPERKSRHEINVRVGYHGHVWSTIQPHSHFGVNVTQLYNRQLWSYTSRALKLLHKKHIVC